MNHLIVERVGLLASVQDLGRPGHGSIGVSRSGAADTLALRIANRLLGNDDRDAGIEVTLLGGVFTATCDTHIALAGAPCGATIDGREVFPLRPLTLRAGERLELAPTTSGVHTYIAVAGGVRTQPVLGSRSTHTTTGFGSDAGRALRAGDRLPITHTTARAPDVDRDALMRLARPALAARVRTVGGHALRCAVDRRADRMGTRLLPERPLAPASPIVPEAMFHGVVQHTPDGALIALGPDAAPTGGYPVFATVIDADLPALAQLRPGARVELIPVSIEQAWRLAREQAALLDTALPPAETHRA
ncbi:MAG: biotin-dependent carboxyltransferase family protein [Phycisphaerales bacterium]